MAKQSGLGDNFYIGGFDLSGDLSVLDKISGGPALLEATTIKQSAHSRLGGLRTGEMSFTSLFEVTGTISTPGFPGSTVPVTNTTGVPVLVTITGGTLSAVVVNGVTVGSTAGTYQVPAGQTISVTYTVLPAWTWTAIGTEHNALSTLPRADVIATYMRGTSVGNPAACMVSKQVNYDADRSNKGDLLMKVTCQPNAFGLEWGEQLTAGLRTDTTATTGAFRDDGGSGTAFGCQAYLQLVALVGTNVDVSITHCTTSGGSYTTLLDFGSQTAIGAFRQATANNATVNEFLKVVTTGTFTYAQFAVVFVRNPIAGQVF